MSDLELILLDAATASLGTLKYRKQKIPNKAAWFDNKCKASRNIFHKDRKRHSNHKCPANRNALINSSKHYKQVIRTSGAKCKSEINYINSLNKRKPMENVNIETFYDFVKTLNADITDTDDTAEPDFPNVDIDNSLNEEISTDEVKNAIQ